MTRLFALNRMVWPSAGACATTLLPMMVPPPGFISTITGCPH
jgi:hypothetical protein